MLLCSLVIVALVIVALSVRGQQVRCIACSRLRLRTRVVYGRSTLCILTGTGRPQPVCYSCLRIR
jgi:hypothetical protein